MKKLLIVMLAMGLLGSAWADIEDGLIAYWDFNSGFQSLVPGSPVCVMEGDPQFVDGPLGKAMHFDGSGDIVYMESGSGSYVDGCDDGMTIMAWVKQTSSTGWNTWAGREGESGRGWQIRNRSNNNACFTTRDADSSNNDGSSSSMQVTDGVWRLVVATFDLTAGEKRLYINGALDQTDTAVNAIPNSPASFSMGGRMRDNGNRDGFANVALDEVALWERPLSEAEVAKLYSDAVAGRLFTEPSWAVTPVSPAYGATGILEAGTMLEWASSSEASPDPIVQYDVWLSIGEPNRLPEHFLGSVNGDTLQMDSGALLHDSTYFWQVDAVTDSDTATSYAWSFDTVTLKPVIGVDPVSTSVYLGETATFAVEASALNGGVIDYQWYKGGVAMAGETSDSLTITDAGDSDGADYYCVASNIYGGNQSGTASLGVVRMIGHWTFDEIVDGVAFDTSPHDPVMDATARLGGGVSHPDANSLWSPDGMIGGCIDLTGGGGSGPWFDTGLLASGLGLGGNSPKSCSAWVYTRSFNNAGIFDMGNRADTENWSLRTLTTDHRWRIQYWGGDYDFTTTGSGNGKNVGDYEAPTHNAWAHMVLTHDGAATKIYLNGRLIVDWGKTINTTDNFSFRIGAYGNGPNGIEAAWDGLIDDVRLFDNALSGAQVREIYSAVRPDDPICLGGNPVMDLSGDCQVNIADLALFIAEYLNSNTVPERKTKPY